MFARLQKKGFDILTLHHAAAILGHDMPNAVAEIESVLVSLEIPVEQLIRSGGGEAHITQHLRRTLAGKHGWKKHVFTIKKTVDGQEKESVSHEIDHVKRFEAGTFALEIEWNNKDPFFDRDLENYKRLHADGVISIGAIITRGSSLQESLRDKVAQFARRNGVHDARALGRYYNPTQRQLRKIQKTAESKTFEDAWAHEFVADKFGAATTHWRKLEDRVRRGVGNPCPLLLIGIPDKVLVV